jgi:hypothetical protein
MDNTALLVKMSNGMGYLGYNMACEVFAEVSQFDDLMEQLSSVTKLEYQVVVIFGFRKADQTNNVVVVDTSHDLDFLENIRSLEKKKKVPLHTG